MSTVEGPTRWEVGEVTVTKIVEIEALGGMRRILPEATLERVQAVDWLYPHFCDENGRMRGSIHALLVETSDRKMIVDTCIGNDKVRNVPAWNQLQTRFLDDLASAGCPRESIDTVLCTHLHIDHVGWNTMLVNERWVPTFTHARYLFGEDEFNHWHSTDLEWQQQVMVDSVNPIMDAGLADLVSTSHQVCDEIRLLATPGHTPGHVSVLIESLGERALITGDFLHHPCQIAHPEWGSSVDSDSQMARATRLEMFDSLAGTPTLVIGTHFASPTAGHLVRDGDTYRLDV